MSVMEQVRGSRQAVQALQGPRISRALVTDVRWAWIWLILRLYVGWQWLEAGWGKLHSAAWVGDKAGAALTGFVQGALTKTGGAHPDVQGWYGAFLRAIVLPNATVWGYAVAIGELLVGISLILGIFTAAGAFFGGFMNMNYLLAGTVSTNPILLFLAALVFLAWKTAGWWGLDRWVLPAVGTPWQLGYLFRRRGAQQRVSPNPS